MLTDAVVVMGHTSCGGVKTAIRYAQQDAWTPSSALDYYLSPLVSTARASLAARPGSEVADEVMVRNVQRQVDTLVSTDVVQANWHAVPSPLTGQVMGKVAVHGCVHLSS